MLMKVADKIFSIAFSLNVPILFDLSKVICLKELATCSNYQVIRLTRSSTYLGYFMYIKHTKTKGIEKIFEIGVARLNG